MNNSINLGQVAITTKKVLRKQSYIVKAIHDDEGYWIFLDEEQSINEINSSVLSLGEVLEIDPTIGELLEMSINKQAVRKNHDCSWIISDFFYEED